MNRRNNNNWEHEQLFHNKFITLPLSSSGRPTLYHNEIEVLLRDKVSILTSNGDVYYKQGVLTLTTHRIFWIHTPSKMAIFLNIKEVINARLTNNFLHKRVYLYLKDQKSQSLPTLKLNFDLSGHKEFLTLLKEQMERKLWFINEKEEEEKRNRERGIIVPGSNKGFQTSRAGITGIIRKTEKDRSDDNKLATEAFSDLQGLMQKAGDMVAIIEKYVSMQQQQQQQQQNDDQTTRDYNRNDNDDQTTELGNILLDIGISSPVTKQSAGTLYHQQLARQLSDFLKNSLLLEKNNGMLTLADTYCFFNRARGTELISPDDLMDSCRLLRKLELGMRLRHFDSGVNVIQDDNFNEEKLSNQIKEIAANATSDGNGNGTGGGGITAIDISNMLKVSLTLAQQFLLTAELSTHLCRDESVEGLIFYPNLFV